MVTKEEDRFQKAFRILQDYPLLNDVTSMTVEVRDHVANFFDQNGRFRMSMPVADYEAILKEEGQEK
jgi:hypothetical protein